MITEFSFGRIVVEGQTCNNDIKIVQGNLEPDWWRKNGHSVEIDDVQDLHMELTVNGEVRQKANTVLMIHPVAKIVSFLSHLMTLEPGDIIATGTPSGVGMATDNFLKAGDRIEASIENLGTLTNTLGPRPDTFYEPLR